MAIKGIISVALVIRGAPAEAPGAGKLRS